MKDLVCLQYQCIRLYYGILQLEIKKLVKINEITSYSRDAYKWALDLYITVFLDDE